MEERRGRSHSVPFVLSFLFSFFFHTYLIVIQITLWGSHDPDGILSQIVSHQVTHNYESNPELKLCMCQEH